MEESDYYTLYNDDDNREFLFKMLQHFVLGGPVNQVYNGLCIRISKAELSIKTL